MGISLTRDVHLVCMGLGLRLGISNNVVGDAYSGYQNITVVKDLD